MERLMNTAAMVGKTVAAVAPKFDDYYLVVRFTDDTFISLSVNGEDEDIRADGSVSDVVLCAAGVISERELKARQRKAQREREKYTREYERKQYEWLKAKFEPESE
jgi:hypothetical protein